MQKSLSISEIYEILPPDCLLKQFYQRRPELSTIHRVLFLDGNLSLNSINLDPPEYSQYGPPCDSEHLRFDEEYSVAIVVRGNVKANLIFSLGTSTSLHLIVIGNLEADYLIASGSQIYVTGDFSSTGLVLGSSGYFMVERDFRAHYLIDFDDHEIVAQSISFTKYWGENTNFGVEAPEDYARERLLLAIDGSYLYPEEFLTSQDINAPESWGIYLRREEMIKARLAGIEILKRVGSEPTEEPRLPLFRHVSFLDTPNQIWNYKEMERIFGFHHESQIEFEGPQYKVIFHKEYNGIKNNSVFVFYVDDCVFAISHSITKIFFFKKVEVLAVYVQPLEASKRGYYLSKRSDPMNKRDQIIQIWNDFLIRIEIGCFYFNQFRTQVTNQKIFEFVNLPIVMDYYNDWKSSDLNGFYVGNFKYSFRNPELCPGDNNSPQLRISVPTTLSMEEGQFDCRHYRFQWDPQNPDNQFPDLFYTSSQEEKKSGRYNSYTGSPVFIPDWELYKEATRWFSKAEVNIAKTNDRFLKYQSQVNRIVALNKAPYSQWPSEDLSAFFSQIIPGGLDEIGGCEFVQNLIAADSSSIAPHKICRFSLTYDSRPCEIEILEFYPDTENPDSFEIRMAISVDQHVYFFFHEGCSKIPKSDFTGILNVDFSKIYMISHSEDFIRSLELVQHVKKSMGLEPSNYRSPQWE